MSNRDDWEALATEVLDQNCYSDDPQLARAALRERLIAEFHNAFVAGQEHEERVKDPPWWVGKDVVGFLRRRGWVVRKNGLRKYGPGMLEGNFFIPADAIVESHEVPDVAADRLEREAKSMDVGAPPNRQKALEQQTDHALVENLAQYAEEEGFVGPNVNSIKRELKKRLGIEADAEVVWANECRLVFSEDPTVTVGEMGLCYPECHGEVQVAMRIRKMPEIRKKLMGVPVRIMICRVPGGNV